MISAIQGTKSLRIGGFSRSNNTEQDVASLNDPSPIINKIAQHNMVKKV